MHILFLSDNFPPETNAPAARLAEHARVWVAAGHRVTVITGAPNFPDGVVHTGYANRWYARELADGVEVVRVKTYIAPNAGFARRTLDYLSFMVSAVLAGLVQERPDVVVATSPQFFAAVAGRALAWLRRRPFVFELRDLWPASIAAVGALPKGRALGVLERLELALYRGAAAIVPVTRAFERDLVLRGVDPRKIQVVTNGADLETYRPRPRDLELARSLGLEGCFVLGYLGTHGLAHALERALDAAELLAGEERLRFLFVGSGAARAGLEREARRRGLSGVVFAPAVPKGEIARYWSLCDAALVHLKDAPVFATVIPSKMFEAFAMGLPVVFAGPDGEAAEIVRATGAGLALRPEDPAALAEAVRRLAGDRELRARLARAARAAAPAYARPALARAMLDVLERAARGELPERPDTAAAAEIAA